MQVLLTSSQEAEMADRSADIDALMAALSSRGRGHATREEAFLAWSQWSDDMAVSWLVVMSPGSMSELGRDEIATAYDSLVLADLRRRAAAVLEREGAERVQDIVVDHIHQTSVDEEDPDILMVTTISTEGREDVLLGRMRQWSADDQGLVDVLADRLDIELPRGFASLYARSNLLTPLGIAVFDREGASV